MGDLKPSNQDFKQLALAVRFIDNHTLLMYTQRTVHRSQTKLTAFAFMFIYRGVKEHKHV